MEDFSQGWVPRWLEEMDKLVFQICLAAGKAKSKGKLKKHYRQMLKRGRKATDALAEELNRIEPARALERQAPSRRGLEAVRDELLEKVLAYNCCRRILMKKRRQQALDPAA